MVIHRNEFFITKSVIFILEMRKIFQKLTIKCNFKE